MNPRWFVLLISLFLDGCAPPSNIDTATSARGFITKDVDPERVYEVLLAEQEGWRLWNTDKQGSANCIAVKPARGRDWPTFAEDYRSVSGGSGFFMYFLDQANTPYYGFYGTHPYRWLSIVEVDGKRIPDTNDGNVVLSWEGREITFSIDTQPTSSSHREVATATGTVDFTGVRQAQELMLRCHARIAGG